MDDTNSTPTPPVAPVTQDFESRLGLLKSRLTLAQAFCKKPHDAWLKWISEYEIDDIGDTEEIRDKVRIGYIFRRIESDLPAIFDDQPQIFLHGQGKDKVLNPLIQSVYDYLWATQNLEVVIEDAATYFLLLGMAAISSPWVTKTKQVPDPQGTVDEKGKPVLYTVPEKDDPDATTEDMFKIFFSPETKFNTLLDYNHCPYYFKKHTMIKEEVKARFGKDVDPTEDLSTDTTEVNTEIQNLKKFKDDMKRVTVYEYYGVLPQNLAKGIKGAGEWTFDKDYHIWFTPNEELLAEECPYPVKPMLLLGNYGLMNKFWKFGEAKHLRPLVSELQQYRSQILKHTRKMAEPKPMIPAESDVDEDAFRDPTPGRIVKYTATQSGEKPYYLSPSQLGAEVGAGIDMVRTDLEQTSGSFQLSQGSGVSQVKTPRGIQTYSEASDRNVARKKKKIARIIKALLLFQFKQCSMNWTPNSGRTITIVSGDVDENIPIVPEVLQVLGDDNILALIDIETESLSLNKVQLKQDALDLFDLASKYPYIFNLDELAKDVLQNGFGKRDADRYLATDQQKQQYYDLAKINRSNIRAAVQIDGADPIGAQLLENEGFLQPGQGQQLSQVATAQKTQQDVSTSVPYQALPPEGQIQKAAQAGIQLSPQGIIEKQVADSRQKAQQITHIPGNQG